MGRELKSACLGSLIFLLAIIINIDICFAQGMHTDNAVPVYPGGFKALEEFIEQNIQYPKEAIKKGITGTVSVSYIITKEGKIENIKLLRGIGAECDSEAIRVTRLIIGWQPAVQWGKPVNFKVTMPIEFCYENANQNKKSIIVSGTVSDQINGNPLEGILILIKGTNIGTISDSKGWFSLEVADEESELEFSSTAYIKKSEKRGKNSVINVELLPGNSIVDFSSNQFKE